jgi:hypothetical protein
LDDALEPFGQKFEDGLNFCEILDHLRPNLVILFEIVIVEVTHSDIKSGGEKYNLSDYDPNISGY